MGKGERTGNTANAREAHAAGVNSVQEYETRDGNLTALLEVVENMSMQLDEISSYIKGMIRKSNAAESFEVADSQKLYGDMFLHLKQTNTVAEYQKKFEELRDLKLPRRFGISEGSLISGFLKGLKHEIRRSMGNHEPKTLYHAFNLARIKEIEIDETIKDNLRRLNREEQILASKSVQVFVSMNSNRLKLAAFIGEKAISVLLYSGVSHSFIDSSLVKHVGSKLVEAEPLLVVFSFLGHEAVSRFRFPKLQWKMEGRECVADMRVVDIKKYEMILGADWNPFH